MALDRAVDAGDAAPAGDYGAPLGECQRAISRLVGLKLSMIAAADQAPVATRSRPDRLSPDQVTTVLQTLVDKARTTALVKTRLTLCDNGDGTTTPDHLHGKVAWHRRDRPRPQLARAEGITRRAIGPEC